MGGTKRKSIAQMEKTQQTKEEEKAPKKKSKAAAVVEKKALSIGLSNIKDEALFAELEKMKAITPASLAGAYGVRVSVAKNFLRDLQKKNIVSLVEGCGRIKIYKSIAAA